MKEAIALYEQALSQDKSHAGYCLALVHALEIVQNYREAVECIKEFCNTNLGMKVGNLHCRQVYQLLGNVENLQNANPMKETDASISIPFTAQELDLLALFFTLVKILFISGSLELILPLFVLLGVCCVI